MRKSQRRATISSEGALRMVARMVAPLWMTPAILINIDWTVGIASPWNLAALGSILAAALFVEAAGRARCVARSTALVLGAVLLILTNVQVAFENASHRSADRSDHRRAELEVAQRSSSQRLQWSQARKEAAEVAGEASTTAIDAQIRREVSRNARRWQATSQCDPKATSARASMVFCGRFAELQAQYAAAVQRDQLDSQIQRLDAREVVATATTSIDPFSDAVSALARTVGVQITAMETMALVAQRDVFRALSLELVAALGPSAWLLLLRQSAYARYEYPSQVRNPSAERGLKTQADEQLDRFVAERLCIAKNSTLSAGVGWLEWQAWCSGQGLATGTQKSFGARLKRRFKHDRNHNRPRYLGVSVRVSAKESPHSLRLGTGS